MKTIPPPPPPFPSLPFPPQCGPRNPSGPPRPPPSPAQQQRSQGDSASHAHYRRAAAAAAALPATIWLCCHLPSVSGAIMEEMFFQDALQTPSSSTSQPHNPPLKKKKLIDARIKVWMKNAAVAADSVFVLEGGDGSRAAPARPLSAPLQRGATRRCFTEGAFWWQEKAGHISEQHSSSSCLMENCFCSGLLLFYCVGFLLGWERVGAHVC